MEIALKGGLSVMSKGPWEEFVEVKTGSGHAGHGGGEVLAAFVGGAGHGSKEI